MPNLGTGWRRAAALLAVLGVMAARAESAPVEVKVDREFLAGLIEKLPPAPFQAPGRYHGMAQKYRLTGIDPAARQVLVTFEVEGDFDERAAIANLVKRGKPKPSASKPATTLTPSGDEGRWKHFRFEVKAGINAEPGPGGAPRFRVEVDEIKKKELDGLAGSLATLLGHAFDDIATSFAEKKTAKINAKINAEITKRIASLTNYGVLSGVDYLSTHLVLRFDLTRLQREGIIGHVYTSARPGTVPLYRWSHLRRGDHFYSLDPREADPRVYQSEGIACYVLPGPTDGAVPLNRYIGRKERFYTTLPDSYWASRAGYHREGVACHVFLSPQQDTVPLFSFFDPRSGLHFYTTHPHAEFAK